MMVHCPTLSGLPGVHHAWFTRVGGASEGLYRSLNTGLGSSDDRAVVLENRRRIAVAMGVPAERLVTCYQIHSPDVVTVTEPWPPEENPKADALVTKVPGIAIGVSSADCGPVLFADAEAGVVGAAHAGWKGALTGVLENTIAAMERLGADRVRIHATVGPMISRDAYEVGPEFVARFAAAGEDVDRWFTPAQRSGHAMFDLPAFIVHRLRRAGVHAASDLGLCTYSDEDRFFSYRRTTHRAESDYGRHLSAIALSG